MLYVFVDVVLYATYNKEDAERFAKYKQEQIKYISDLYYNYEIYELLKYVDELCEHNFKEGMTLKNTNNAI